MEDFTDEQDPTGQYRAAITICELLGSPPCRALVDHWEMVLDSRDRVILEWALETLLSQAAFIAHLRHQLGGDVPPDLAEAIRTMAHRMVQQVEVIRGQPPRERGEPS